MITFHDHTIQNNVLQPEGGATLLDSIFYVSYLPQLFSQFPDIFTHCMHVHVPYVQLVQAGRLTYAVIMVSLSYCRMLCGSAFSWVRFRHSGMISP